MLNDFENKITILIIVPAYLPGYRAGGPIRSIASLVELLGDEFDFKIITYDRDLGMMEPYAGIVRDTWRNVGKAEVYYASKMSLRFLELRRLINSVKHDILYLNSFFSPTFTIKPLLLRYLKLIPDVGTIVAPRGEFSQGALKLKWWKKQLYILVSKALGLYRNLLWQASSGFEKKDIECAYSRAKISIALPIMVAPDLVSKALDNSIKTSPSKQPGTLNIVFLSRISPMKNLDGALEMLKGIQGDITFNIFGPTEDKQYWQTCENICKDLGANIKVLSHGEVDHARVHEIFSSNHLFFFPTHGENFGHVILEALLAGCPVLLSDQTPWRNLESIGIGWDLSLDKPDKFRAVLKQCVDMNNDQFTKISRRAADYGKSTLNDSTTLRQNKDMLCSALYPKLIREGQALF